MGLKRGAHERNVEDSRESQESQKELLIYVCC